MKNRRVNQDYYFKDKINLENKVLEMLQKSRNYEPSITYRLFHPLFPSNFYYLKGFGPKFELTKRTIGVFIPI
jgi:hypothetical protein